MKNIVFIVLFSLAFLGCKNSAKPVYYPITSIQTQDIIKDSLLNIRALEVDGFSVRAVSSRGDVYAIDIITNAVNIDRVSTDTINFRASALVNEHYFTLSIGSPAYLFKNQKLVIILNFILITLLVNSPVFK